MRYRLKLKDTSKNTLTKVYKLLDKEINKVKGSALQKELNKEIETWLTWGKIKPYYAKNYSPELINLINSIIKKYHKKYKAMWEQAQILEKYYEETDLEEMEESYEVTMSQVQVEKNKIYYDQVLPELNKLLKEQGFLDKK